MPIKEIETKIFGFPQNRLSWTPYGSSLSEHRPRKSFLKNELSRHRPYQGCRKEGTRRSRSNRRVLRKGSDHLMRGYSVAKACMRHEKLCSKPGRVRLHRNISRSLVSISKRIKRNNRMLQQVRSEPFNQKGDNK
jgi:hypothetical protein